MRVVAPWGLSSRRRLLLVIFNAPWRKFDRYTQVWALSVTISDLSVSLDV